MKYILIKISVAALFITTAAFTVYNDISETTGLQVNTIQAYIVSDLAGDFDDKIYNPVPVAEDSFRIPITRMLPSIMSGDKAGVAKEACNYIKLYCNSQKFTDEYNYRRLSALPLADNSQTASDLMHSTRVHKTNIKNYPNSTQYVADEQALLDADQKKLDALLEKAKGPFPLKAEWEKMYPSDPAVLLKRRLQEYLALVATVDFTAQLTSPDKYKKRKFVNPVYEKKNLKWKAIYRAGKEVNDVVTAFVKNWLKGEIISKEKAELPGEKNTKSSSLNNENSSINSANTNTNNNTTAGQAETGKDKKSSLFKKIKGKAKDAVNRQLR